PDRARRPALTAPATWLRARPRAPSATAAPRVLALRRARLLALRRRRPLGRGRVAPAGSLLRRGDRLAGPRRGRLHRRRRRGLARGPSALAWNRAGPERGGRRIRRGARHGGGRRRGDCRDEPVRTAVRHPVAARLALAAPAPQRAGVA